MVRDSGNRKKANLVTRTSGANKRPAPVRVGLVAQNDFKGGAGFAVASLRSHIRKYGETHGLEAFLRVVEYQHDSNADIRGGAATDPVVGLMRDLRTKVRRAVEKYVLAQPGQLRSRATMHTGLGIEINDWDVDIINFHWLGDNTISLGEIAKIRHPVVFTLHDLWPGLGTLHYPEDVEGSSVLTQKTRWLWLEKHFEGKKKTLWGDRFFAIAPSQSVAERAKQSPVMEDWPIFVVPNAIDTDFWAPGDRSEARQKLGIAEDAFLVVFPAGESGSEHRKGGDLWEAALGQIAQGRSTSRPMTCIRVSSTSANQTYPWGVERHMAPLSRDQLRTLYQAANLVAVPSRQETFSLVALEAQSCGVPVIGFDVMGVSDAIVHDHTGFHVSPFDVEEFGRKITVMEAQPDKLEAMGHNARQRVVSNFAPAHVVALTADVMRQVLDRSAQRESKESGEELA